jgi:peptide/nickel transport system substrate-binding protein
MMHRASSFALNRRRLLGAAALGTAAPFLSGSITKLQSASAAEPGEVAIAWNAPPPDFNPLTSVSRAQYFFFVTVMSSLTQANPEDQTFAPDLAESWEIAPDGSAYTFHLRQNATWHDGQPVTARDVAFTYTRALDPDTLSKQTGKLSLIKGAAAYTAKEADEVTGIQVVDDHTITFEMEFPTGLFLNETTAVTLAILPEHLLGDVPPADLEQHDFFINSPVGSGPFRFVEYRPDQYVEVEANPDYYFGRPNLDRIIFNIIQSPDTIQVAMGREEIDMPVFDGGTAERALYENALTDERFRVDGTQGSAIVGYGWNYRHEDLVDPRIHQAFLYALDRPALVSAFNSNNGTIINSFMTHSWYQDPEWANLYPYDPERAEALLQDAGWDSNRTVNVNVITLANEDIRAMLAAEQQMLAEVGFNIQFQEMELPVWVESFYDTHDFELVRVTFGVFPDPDGFLNFHLKTTSQNAFGYANPELDAQIDEARRIVDQESRIPLYQAINEEMLQALPVTPLFLENLWWVRNQKWHVPQLDKLPVATSLETIPVAPILLNAEEVWGYRQDEWTKS